MLPSIDVYGKLNYRKSMRGRQLNIKISIWEQ